MKKFLFILLFFISLTTFSQNGGACIYILPNDNTVVCEIYGNAGVPSENACQANALSAGALPINCPDYLNGCSAAYIWDGISCFFIGSGSCNASTICENVYLPVDLIKFEVNSGIDANHITWSTASESNSSHYSLIVYNESMDKYASYTISAMGTTNSVTTYRFIHHNPNRELNYYQLVQYDFNGDSIEYDYIVSDNRVYDENPIKIFNIIGQEVDNHYKGIVVYKYPDGSSKIMYN